MAGTEVSQSSPRRAASAFHWSEYPFPSKWMGRESTMSARISSRRAWRSSSPAARRESTADLNSMSCCATQALRAIIADAQLADEPTARNSNRLPVNANGDVRFRSVLSSMISGICDTLSRSPSLVERSDSSSLDEDSIRCRISASCDPVKIDMIAGGASLAPRRWALVAEAMDAFRRPLWR